MDNIYKKSGVDVEAGQEVVVEIKKLSQNINNPYVLKNNIGMFAGGFDISSLNYKKPVIFSSTDGIGTKIILAIENNKLDNLGQDLVAMCANDIVCHGAKPLFFLDYIGINKVEVSTISLIINSILKSLNTFDCALLGGETAELKLIYKPNEFDLAGMITGVCEKDEIIDISRVKKDQVIIAIESSGLHSNGYTLINNLVSENKISLKDVLDNKESVLEALIKPTYLYVNVALDLAKNINIKGFANNTGGGIFENLPRCLSSDVDAEIEFSKLPKLDIFNYLQSKINSSPEELNNIWNMGMGFFVLVDKKDEELAIKIISNHNFKSHTIGRTVKGNKKVNINWTK